MDKIYTFLIRCIGNIIYAINNIFMNKEYVLLDTCFNNIEDSDIGVCYRYYIKTDKVIIVKNNIEMLKSDEILKKSLKYYIVLSKAKIVITNNTHHLYVNKNKDTLIFNTWHGTPYKDVSINTFATKVLKFANRNLTAHISGNQFFEETYIHNTIQYNGQILRHGSFRNDVLLSDDFFYQEYEFCQNGKGNILICPTWRDYGDEELLEKISELITLLNKKFYDKYNILLRMHNRSSLRSKNDKLKYYDVSDNTFETQKLLKVTDILITDYSSIFIDYSILLKPIILYQFDLDKYKTDRGLIIDKIEEYGLNVCIEASQVALLLDTLDVSVEINKVNKFNNLICHNESGESFDEFIKIYN